MILCPKFLQILYIYEIYASLRSYHSRLCQGLFGKNFVFRLKPLSFQNCCGPSPHWVCYVCRPAPHLRLKETDDSFWCFWYFLAANKVLKCILFHIHISQGTSLYYSIYYMYAFLSFQKLSLCCSKN